jgi:3-methyladenine DNA glycosylase AlkD
MRENKSLLYKLARSANVLERKMALEANLHFIQNTQFNDKKIARILLHDDHDLIHKALAWMLCKVGKREIAAKEAILKSIIDLCVPYYAPIYAMERLPEK